MTTAQDLLLTSLDAVSSPPVSPGDLSLALAGAELIDLLDARALALDGALIVPGDRRPVADRLLAEAASSLVRQAPYESVEDWLWRRGRGLSSAYLAALEAEGGIVRERGRRIPVRTGRTVLVDSPARRRADARWASGDPVLAGLVAAAGFRQEHTDEASDGASGGYDGAVETVLAAVGDAVMELEAVRQRRTVEDAAFDNIWRGQ
ncbi:GPP34 family phosphoprotein [Kitasatospora sp. NBC_00240]|uniref:GOLPH3/VPS74 family protein n=1 Tax=Kitasatospora sp. NBC_00240 TaxID=2903567 RepID=UPI002253DE3B|nr:GPP34 family phosphoprotein [Kitasatospora sp. NBC_00240]MCX5209385.1 GPP34 family phosphoprotein [Kitasatospora sp. NBC_00240]